MTTDLMTTDLFAIGVAIGAYLMAHLIGGLSVNINHADVTPTEAQSPELDELSIDL